MDWFRVALKVGVGWNERMRVVIEGGDERNEGVCRRRSDEGDVREGDLMALRSTENILSRVWSQHDVLEDVCFGEVLKLLSSLP